MAGWNGSGLFLKTNTWVQDQINGIKIRADRHDENDVDFVSGINNCMTKDGQNTAIADLDMGGNKLKNGATATLINDFTIVSDIQNSKHTFITSTGSANAYVLTLSPAPAAYVAGQTFRFKANFLSTGAATLNVNGLGVKNIKLEGFWDLAPYAIKTDQVVTVIYDGTQFQPHNMDAVTGDMQMWSSSTVKPGWLQLNGTTTIGSLASAAGDNADVNEGLWKHLYDATDDAEAAVSGGRTTRDADWTANKTLTLPETDDSSPFGIGSTLTKGFKTSGAATVASTGSITINAVTLSTANMPPHTHSYSTGEGGQGGAEHASAQANQTSAKIEPTTSTGSGSAFTPTGSFSGSASSVLHPVFGTFFIIKI